MAFIGKKPTAAPLTSSDVADGIITNAKLAQDIISADTALGAAPADTDEFLVSDAGVLKRMDYSYIKGGGKVLQLLTATTTTRVNVATTSYTDIGLSLAITPAATSSKIFALWKISANMDSSRGYGAKLLRDTTAVFTSQGLNSILSQTNSFRLHGVYTHLDSPSSTSEITYKIQCGTGSSGQVDFQENDNSDLVLIEIGA